MRVYGTASRQPLKVLVDSAVNPNGKPKLLCLASTAVRSQKLLGEAPPHCVKN